MTTPDEGVTYETGSTLDEATNAFLDRWKDADDKPSDTKDDRDPPAYTEDAATVPGAGDNESDAEDEDLDLEDDDESTEKDQSDSDSANLEATDDQKVTITVDGETKAVTVKDLKRLYGQEAALTRKSQEVATERKKAETETERYVVAAQKLITKAQERYAPFEKIDWMVAQQRLQPEEFSALRQEAREAHADLTFLNSETDDVLKHIQTVKSAERAEAAKESIAILERDIPGWNREAYDKVRTYAVEKGMDAEIVNSIIDPNVLKFIHNSMRYESLKAKAALKKTNPKAAPKRVVRPSNGSPQNIGKPKDKAADAIASLRKTGSRDDAVNAFMGRWADSDD